MIDYDMLLDASRRVRCDLVASREESGRWTGELSSSALSTATAVSALAVVERRGPTDESGRFVNLTRETQLGVLIVDGLRWLSRHQNADGGWGDTDRSHSNIATTMLVRAAFHLTGVPAEHADMLDRAEQYIEAAGGVDGLRRRYGRDKTFAVPILTNAALAELVPWRQVSPLPFELAALPQSWYRFLRLPVVSYAIPALVAIGQARFHHRPPWNPLTRWIRRLAIEPSLRVLERMQPASGGFLEAAPLTSFVVMSLASIGRIGHPVVERGVKFLIESVRPDGSWPIDTNLATWNTTLAVNALSCDERGPAVGKDRDGDRAHVDEIDGTLSDARLLDWILSCQQRERHPYTGAAPGGWAWTDLPGGVPDADDTSGALLALAALRHRTVQPAERQRIDAAAALGLRWLVDLQNGNGGWPTFCRGWGKLPFDRSGSDLTAHALRAMAHWRRLSIDGPLVDEPRMERARRQGLAYLQRSQRPDGSWTPLWFGNQDHADEENPIYGTAKVLLAYRDLRLMDAPAPRRAVAFLLGCQNADGGWGGPGMASENARRTAESTVEETALAVEALLAADAAEETQVATNKGLTWLIQCVARGGHTRASPIGFYFARLWYYERLYPLAFTASALGQAVARLRPRSETTPRDSHTTIRSR
ncbi:MAG: prenyltransferase/squalene oxidase repeat-containing protein [Pirellulales bacterium]